MASRILSVITLLLILSACGGGGGGNTPNNGQNNLPGLQQQPQLLSLNFPGDFPYTHQFDGSLQAILVNGMTPMSAYDFTYSASSSEIALLMTNNIEPGGFVCTSFIPSGDNRVCTGTVLGDGIAVAASNSTGSSQTFTLDIQTSTSTPYVNHGSEQAPEELNFTENFSLTSTVATLGDSYYRINGLTTGSRYLVEIIDPGEEDVGVELFRDLFVTDIQCDPNFKTTSLSCIFVSDNNTATINVTGDFAFAGAIFDINIELLSTANEFEGTWYTPQVLDIRNGGLPRIGVVDEYHSYYHLSGLEIDRRYTAEFTSKTGYASLLFFDPITGRSIFNACNPDTRTNLTSDTDEACTFQASSADLYVIAKGSSQSTNTSRFIVKLTPGPVAEGSSASPVALTYNGGNLVHKGKVDVTSSYYRVSGITPGNDYMIRLSGNESLSTGLLVYDGDSSFATPVTCTITNDFGLKTYCITTAVTSDFYIKVDGPVTPPGINYTFNVTPVPTLETIENLPATNLPYAGSVNDSFSEYTVTGLTSNRLYIAQLVDANGTLALQARDDASSAISCGFITRVSGGCLLDSGPNGIINMRVGKGNQGSDNNEPGGFFKIDISPAPVLTANHQSADTPIAIPDNVPAGVNSEIIVSSPITNIASMTVEVFIEHGYTPNVVFSLTAPNGTNIPLAANLSNSEYSNTHFNDYADTVLSKPATQSYNATFRPTSPLYVLNGIDPNGTWKFNVADDFDSNRSDSQGGTLHGWGLSFE